MLDQKLRNRELAARSAKVLELTMRKDLLLCSGCRLDTMKFMAELIHECITNIETNHQPVQEVI